MQRYLMLIVVMLALAGLTAACNPLWEAPPIERLRATSTAAAVTPPASAGATR